MASVVAEVIIMTVISLKFGDDKEFNTMLKYFYPLYRIEYHIAAKSSCLRALGPGRWAAGPLGVTGSLEVR